jgi:predicted 3-demethylubiquinone-9 3-methyltransferase (glyoxalase superfamily)
MASIQKIAPFLWFDGNAEEAADFYISIFPDSAITSRMPYSEAVPGPEGSLLSINFTLSGVEFIALNGGPQFKFNESVSFLVHCESQQEIDRYWKKLTDGGQEMACGWLKDKYGLSWQVAPTRLLELMSDKDANVRSRVARAMMAMRKIDLAQIEAAGKH